MTTTDTSIARRLVIDQIATWRHLDEESRLVLADALEDCGLLVVADIVRRNQHWMTVSSIAAAERMQAAADKATAKARRHQEWLAELAVQAQDDESEVWDLAKAKRLGGYWAKNIREMFERDARRGVLFGERAGDPLSYVIVSDEAVTRAGYSSVKNSEVLYLRKSSKTRSRQEVRVVLAD